MTTHSAFRTSSFLRRVAIVAALAVACGVLGSPVRSAWAANADDARVPPFDELLRFEVKLKPELAGVHPRVFVTSAELATLRERAKTTHREQWQRVLTQLPAMQGAPPPPPGPQERRSQNNAALAIAGVSLAYAVEREPRYLEAARRWVLAAIDYEPWGYTYNKPNIDLAAGHLLYAIGWAYDLLYADFTESERARIRASLERHAGLVHDAFAPSGRKRFPFTQNHDFIPTAGLAVAALALMGESQDAPKWAALARAHHHRANQLLSPDGYYYEGIEYWIFSSPWLVHFYDAWEHATGESFWEIGPARHWKHYLAHSLLPDGQSVFDFGDIWEGPLTRARSGAEYARVYPGGTLQSNFNVMYRVASRLRDPEAQAIADRFARFGHSNLEEYWTLLWRDAALAPAPMSAIPLTRHFEDSGVVFHRTNWEASATAFAFKAGPPEGHRVAQLQGSLPEWRLDSGHAHPDAASFIIWAGGRYLTGDTGYAGLPQAQHHNTITVGGVGQGVEGEHDVWRGLPPASLDAVRIASVRAEGGLTIEAEAAAAYPPAAGVNRFRRTFRFEPPGTFTVSDDVALKTPQVVKWHLQSDTAPRQNGRMWLVGGDDVWLRVDPSTPANVTVTSQPTILMAPGKPGSITSGSKDQRGYQVVLESPFATTHRFEVTLAVERR
jgi:hypothetical protein